MADQGSTQDFIRISQYHLALIAGGFGVTGGLIGAWLNHFFSGNRDRRKEFNDAAIGINKKLIEEQRNPHPLTVGPSEIEFDVFAQYISPTDRSNFYKAIEKYNKAKDAAKIVQLEGVPGVIHYKNPSLIINEIENLLKFSKRR